MNLLLFDIDGTLLETSADDDRIFREALLESLPADARPITIGPWREFAEVTDTAIARDVITRACNRPARDGEIITVRKAYIEKWQAALEAGTITVQAKPGALAIIAAALRRPQTVTAIASGSWGPPAIMKLAAAGFPVDDLVIATSDDSETRVGIFNTAGIIALSVRGVPGYSARVVIGDGVWDAKTAGGLNAAFVGVASEPAAVAELRDGGARVVIPHFEPAETFWQAVTTALAQRHATNQN